MPAVAEKKKVVSISKQQWQLPVGFSPDGKGLVSLKEVAKEKVPVLSLPNLSDDQRASLVAARIEAQPKYELATLGAGLIDKERAVKEVKNQSKVGRMLMEIEQRLITTLLQEAHAEEA